MHKIHRMFFDEKVRADNQSDSENNSLPVIEGHAIVANVRGDTSWFTEEIDKEAITKALKDPNLDVASLWNHDTSQPLGRYPDTLELIQDDIGLLTRTKPSNTSYAKDLVLNIEAGIVKQMSFGFWPLEEKLDDSGDLPHFIVTDFRLFDVSPVTFPFYKQTDLWIKRCSEVLEERMKRLGKKLNSRHLEYHAYLKRKIQIEQSKLSLI